MKVEYFFILYIAFLKNLCCMTKIDPKHVNNAESLYSELKRQEYHHLNKRESYEEIFDENFEDYFHESDHALIGSNLEIYHTKYEDGTIKYVYEDSVDKILQPFLYRFNERSISPKRERRSPGDVVYPKLTIFVDYKLYKKFNQDTSSIVEYISSFWNSVDLLYRQLTKPKIRLNIARIFIITNKKAMPYIHHGLCGYIWMNNSLHQMREHMLYQKEINYETPHGEDKTIIFLQTMYRGLNILGTAFTGEPCMVGFGIIHDLGDYSGITNAAHELGHVLGADHDESKKFIMAKNDPSVKFGISRILFSDKSKQEISETIKNETLSNCLYYQPNLGIPFKLKLPGMLFNHEKQCIAAYGEKALPNLSLPGDKQCTKLRCITKAVICVNRIGDSIPLDGMYCGDIEDLTSEICLRGKCVNTPAELM